jgi:hypothetical protein
MSGFDLFGDVTTVDTGIRSDFDFYETPRFQTASLLHHHPTIAGCRVLECCSGRDAIANVLRQAGCEVFTNDLDPRQPAQTHYDATAAEYWRSFAPSVDWIVSNTTFVDAFAILQHAFEHADVGVALLLRKTFTEPTIERGQWMSTHPPTRTICLPRYSYRGTGTDSVPTDWFVWERRPDRSLPAFVIDYAAERRVR